MFDFIERDLIAGPIIKLSDTRTFMGRHSVHPLIGSSNSLSVFVYMLFEYAKCRRGHQLRYFAFHEVVRGEVRRNMDGIETDVPNKKAQQQAKQLLREHFA